MENNLTTRLRNATSYIHKELETLPVSKIIISPELTPAAYIDYLHRMLIIHRTIETRLFSALLEYIPDLDSRRKEMMIRNDLTALHASTEVADVFSDPAFRNTHAFSMGMLYVSEGSTLGGQYILKNVQKTLGEQGVDATTFLNAYGPRTGSMWKTFMQQLDAYGDTLTEEEIQDVQAGATYGFVRTAAVFNTDNLFA